MQQTYKVTESFPFDWIAKRWKDGYYVTSMATAGRGRWAVVMSRGVGFSHQVSIIWMEKVDGHAIVMLQI